MSARRSSRTTCVSSWRHGCKRLQSTAATSATAARLRAVPATVAAIVDVAIVRNGATAGQFVVGQAGGGPRSLWLVSSAAVIIIIIIAAAAQSRARWPSSSSSFPSSSSAGWSGHRRFATLPIGRRFGLRSRGVHVGSTRIETRS
ncbi:Uncharacterized protein APZ42_021882, partial [Daphnia magna]